jgi:hypothetical protein
MKVTLSGSAIACIFLAGLLTAAPLGAQARFSKAAQSFSDGRAWTIATADVDRDGDPDLVIDNYIGPTQLWLNNGKGNFTAVPGNLGGAGTHGLVFADLNKDSWPDLLVLNQNSPSQLFLGNGAGALTAPVQSLGSAGDNPTWIFSSHTIKNRTACG